jgi:hypothetical protein
LRHTTVDLRFNFRRIDGKTDILDRHIAYRARRAGNLIDLDLDEVNGKARSALMNCRRSRAVNGLVACRESHCSAGDVLQRDRRARHTAHANGAIDDFEVVRRGFQSL